MNDCLKALEIRRKEQIGFPEQDKSQVGSWVRLWRLEHKCWYNIQHPCDGPWAAGRHIWIRPDLSPRAHVVYAYLLSGHVTPWLVTCAMLLQELLNIWNPRILSICARDAAPKYLKPRNISHTWERGDGPKRRETLIIGRVRLIGLIKKHWWIGC